jgi:hypothetical protein
MQAALLSVNTRDMKGYNNKKGNDVATIPPEMEEEKTKCFPSITLIGTSGK